MPPAALAWDDIFRAADPQATIHAAAASAGVATTLDQGQLLAPTVNQEV